MQHEVREEDGAVLVAFSGEIDLEHSPKAREVLLECVGGAASVFVDLSRVEYIDSSGVASLVEALQQTRSRGGQLALVSVSASALRVLELARLDKVFTIHESLAEALGGEA